MGEEGGKEKEVCKMDIIWIGKGRHRANREKKICLMKIIKIRAKNSSRVQKNRRNVLEKPFYAGMQDDEYMYEGMEWVMMMGGNV